MPLPFVSDKKPPFYIGDAAVRDGTKPIRSIYDTLDPENLMLFDGDVWVSSVVMSKRKYNVQRGRRPK